MLSVRTIPNIESDVYDTILCELNIIFVLGLKSPDHHHMPTAIFPEPFSSHPLFPFGLLADRAPDTQSVVILDRSSSPCLRIGLPPP